VITDKFMATVRTPTTNNFLHNIFIHNYSVSKIYLQQTVKFNPPTDMGGYAARDGASSKTLDHQLIVLTKQKLGILITLQSASKKGRKRYSGFMKICTDLSVMCEQITCTGIPFSHYKYSTWKE
jgi:hypothetical protein